MYRCALIGTPRVFTMPTERENLLAFYKKRRGVVRASLTKLGTKLAELEASTESPTLLESANTLAEKLKVLQQEYRNHQLSIIDRTESEEELAEEQQALDDNDDQTSTLSGGSRIFKRRFQKSSGA